MNRQEALSFLDKCKQWFEPYTGVPENWHEAIDMAIEALSADAVSRDEHEEVKAYMDTLVDAFIEDGEELAESVKVVRCKDCKNASESLVPESVYCDEMDRAVYIQGFCHHGERREE